MMNPNQICSRCGAPLPPGTGDDACPRCLLNLAIEPTSPASGRNTPFQAPKVEQLARDFPQLEIESLIGQGGMGAVYRARHVGLDRIVALKILPPSAMDEAGFSLRFEREARAMARLSHPNIVSVFDTGRVGDFYYLTMEYVDGINLREAIQAKQITPREALAIVPQICDALQYAHDQGIVHRDIKPENILLNEQGQIKIADFGLARILQPGQTNESLTQTHQVLGTPRYMAPEQIEGGQSVDHRADIYSLGVVFYELLTGELPLGRFEAPSRAAGLDQRLDEVVYRTLEKQPQQRYQQASELKTAVEGLSALPAFAKPLGNNARPVSNYVPGGYEYRSKLTIFGMPFVHVASGFDPRTQKPRVAKGFIAIGNSAVGVFAIGGSALGVFALGGMSIGLFSLGGMSIGLLLALGGCALGTGISVGGLAVGALSVGGLSIGLAALGGGAFGPTALGGNTDGTHAAWFAQFGWRLTVVTAVSLIGLILGILGVAYLVALLETWLRGDSAQTDHTSDWNSSPHKPPVIDSTQPAYHRQRRSTGFGLGLGCAIVVLGLSAMGLVIMALGFAWTVPITRRMEPATALDFDLAEEPHWVELDENGLRLSHDWGMNQLGLSPSQFTDFETIAQSFYKRSITLESPLLHYVATGEEEFTLTVNTMSRQEADKLINEFWMASGEVLNETQLAQAKESLRLMPGAFGMGTEGGRLEMRRENDQVTWNLQTPNRTVVNLGTDLQTIPVMLQRYWFIPSQTSPDPSTAPPK